VQSFDVPAPEGRKKLAQGVSPGEDEKDSSPGGAAQKSYVPAATTDIDHFTDTNNDFEFINTR